MIRNDFVSNSSSSSFIINDCNKIKIDDRLIKILKCIQRYIIFVYDKIPSEISKLIEGNDKFKIFDDSIEIDNPISLGKSDFNILEALFKTCKHITCSCGEDYEVDCLTTQICTMLEIYYGIIPEGKDHFEYDSIQKIIYGEI